MTAGRGLEHRLVSSGALRRETVQMAQRRQQVYGGGLDTVLLEMGLVDEGTLWALLVEEAGLPPLPPSLLDAPVLDPDPALRPVEARRIGALVLRRNEADEASAWAVVRPGFDREALAAVLAGTRADLFIVPEVRFEALLGAYGGQPVPPRFLSLLGRLMGAEQVRRWAAARAPRREPERPLVDLGPAPRTRLEPPAPAEPPAALPPQAPLAPAATERRAAPPPPTPQPAPSPLDEPAPHGETDGDQALEAAVDAAIDRISSPEAAPNRRDADPLLPALELLADLAGGPRTPALATAIVSRWSCAEIFSKLPQLARRGEPAVQAALPLLSSRTEDAALLTQWLRSNNPRERTWAALALGSLVPAPDRTLARLPSDASARRPFGEPVPPEVAHEILLTLCARIEAEPEPEVALAVARALRPAAAMAEVQAVAQRLAAVVVDSAALDPARAHAAALLGQLRCEHPVVVEALIGGIAAKSPQVADTCHGYLVRLTGHDAGKDRGAWQRWWRRHRERPRIAWLVGGLAHRRADVRLAAAHELTALTGQTLGYHFDLPPRARKAAVARWTSWLAQIENG